MFICRFFPKVRLGTSYLSQDILTLGHSRWPLCNFDPMTPPLEHLRSYEVTFFLPLTFDRIEIERWWWSRYVSLVQTHRLIFDMTYLSRHVTSRGLDPRSHSDIDLLISICRGKWACFGQQDSPGKSIFSKTLIRNSTICGVFMRTH